MPKKETPGVVRQDGTRGGGHFYLDNHVFPLLTRFYKYNIMIGS